MKTWKLSSFDLFSLSMTIKGAWTYKELPEASVLQVSLNAVLMPYPQLLGRYDEKQKVPCRRIHDYLLHITNYFQQQLMTITRNKKCPAAAFMITFRTLRTEKEKNHFTKSSCNLVIVKRLLIRK